MIYPIPLFKADDKCAEYKQLLHYTNLDSLTYIINGKTLKCNSLKNVNDQLKQKRKGLEDITGAYYVSCFCHDQHEIVPFWFMYGGDAPDNQKVLLRFKNFSCDFANVVNTDLAYTADRKKLYSDEKHLFAVHKNGLLCCPINDPDVENRQTIRNIRLFNVDYLLPDHEVFSKAYREMGEVSFGKGQDFLPARISDARHIGKHKTIHWKYEEETRIQCALDPIGSYYHDYILLALKDKIFQDLVIVANPWATDEFLTNIADVVARAPLPEEVKSSISIERSELNGQIIERRT